jgi:SAM-dependent methyltransferase
MDRDTVSALTHAGLPFANPLDPGDIDAAIAALDLPPGARVLDVGCGYGELLVRIKQAHPGTFTIGIEPAHEWAQAARARGVDEVREAMLEEATPGADELDAVCCLASSHAIGPWDRALAAMAEWTKPGGLALIGEGFWARTPTPGYLDVLGGASEDELPTHDGLLAGVADAGWTVVAETVASGADWARYEEGLIANGDKALEFDEDEDLRRWVEAARTRWNHPDGRDTLGFTLLTLRR